MKVTNLKHIMDRKVKTIRESATLQEVSRLLIKNKLSGVPVIDKRKHLIGFASERDIIRALASGDFYNMKVKDFMSKKVVSLEDYTTIEVVSKVFTEYPIRYLPVTRKKKLVGIVSRKDVIDKLLGQYY